MRNWILLASSAAVLAVSPLMIGADKAGDAAKGKDVFEQCSVCHNVDSDEKKIGPSLKGLYKHDKLKNGKKVTDDNVLGVINAGGGGMPSYSDTLSDQEKADVIAYLKTI
jgi:cytochrome c